MRNEDNNMMVDWIEDVIDDVKKSKLDTELDLVAMTPELDFLEHAQLKGKSISQSWEAFEKRIETKKSLSEV
jgi:hypothetical protein